MPLLFPLRIAFAAINASTGMRGIAVKTCVTGAKIAGIVVRMCATAVRTAAIACTKVVAATSAKTSGTGAKTAGIVVKMCATGARIGVTFAVRPAPAAASVLPLRFTLSGASRREGLRHPKRAVTLVVSRPRGKKNLLFSTA